MLVKGVIKELSTLCFDMSIQTIQIEIAYNI